MNSKLQTAAKPVEAAAQANESDAPAKTKPYEIDFKRFFKEILIPFTPPRIVLDTIQILIPGDAKASDFEEIIDRESEEIKQIEQEQKLLGNQNTPRRRPRQSFKSLFFMLVNSMGLANEISNIRHAIGVLGVVQVRNAIMGMSLYQHFHPKLSLRFEKIAGGEIEQPIRFALQAEEFAKNNRCPDNLAFIAGLFFDFIVNIISSKKEDFNKLSEGPLKKPDDIIAAIWRHSLAVGLISNFFLQKSKAKIPLGRFTFIAGMLHDLGKLALIAYSPEAYNEILIKRRKELRPFSSFEEEFYDFPHETISSLMLRKLDVFTEVELPIDHHHDHDILAIRNPDMHRMAALLEISDAVVNSGQGFMGEHIETDFDTMPARVIIKLERHFIDEGLTLLEGMRYG